MAAQRNAAPRPINQENPPANQAPAQGNRANPQRRSSGRQPGSNGYSDEDCMALVEIVKEVLPLGSNEWAANKVQSTLQFENDIGNSAGHTQENEEVGQANEADQGNFGNFLDNPMNIGNNNGGDPINNRTRQPNNSQSMSGPIRSNQSQPSPGIPSIVAANTASPSPTLTRNRRSTNLQTQGNLQSSLAAFFDPEACRARDQEAGLTQFYALRLQESTSTINRLQEEVNRLHEGVNLQVIRLQEDLQQALECSHSENLRESRSMTLDGNDATPNGVPTIYTLRPSTHGPRILSVNSLGCPPEPIKFF
ncbi:hypothetical protein PSHT_07960 [Puccinia striiformis]|uniref:Uncharacterized protein n=1 Tax=Puccinia striiformis TaxID=27350 RepID=A0A2S4VTH7_9BASI|nr:hypothetical protein PSHT_07960 [Puccinia striiformis]